jgi:hypothetical protein
MAKRPAEPSEQELETIKNGERPMDIDQNEAEEFEDEYEDEFESEDEILEAGVDGRPDEEREAEEKERMQLSIQVCRDKSTNPLQTPWKWTRAHSYLDGTSSLPARPSHPICRPTKCCTHSKRLGHVYPAT